MKDSEVKKRLDKVINSRMLQINILAALTGAFAAVVTWIFINLTNMIKEFFYGNSFVNHSLRSTDNEWLIIFIPALGGLIAGLIIEYGSKDAKGAGVPIVMEAVAFKQARLSAKKAVAKFFASAASIGTGMSLGRVGPMIVISSTIGSEIGQRTGKTVEETKTIIGCGAASAITAAFNAPLGGVLFAIELILAELKTRSFIPIVVAAVIATAVTRSLAGDVAAFDKIPHYTLGSPIEYPFYIILGLVIGLAASIFIKLMNFVEDNIENIKFVRGDIFDKIFEYEIFDFVWCSGVLHHTKNPYGAFQSIVPYLKKNGYIIIGLYNKIGRFRTKFRKYIYKIFGKKILIKLDPILRKIPNNSQDKINAWIRDQYTHPVESTHTFDEILKWFKMNNIEFINSIPESSPFNTIKKNIFEKSYEATFIERILQQFIMIFSSFGGEGGLFLFVGKKIN